MIRLSGRPVHVPIPVRPRPDSTAGDNWGAGRPAAHRRAGRSREGRGRIEGAAFSGRVVDVDTSKPVEGASIVVVRSIPGVPPGAIPSWVGETMIRTDADGRFRLEFPPDQVAERRLSLALRIKHPGYIPRKSLGVTLAAVIRGAAKGDKPFFETITLEKGAEYTGQIVTPAGKPAAGVPYRFENWAWGNNRSRASS